MSIFFLFPKNVGLPKSPVRSNLEKQDYHREYLKFGNKIILRVVEEETMREFRNSEAAKFPETSSSYWLKDRIDDVMTSVTWQNVQKEMPNGELESTLMIRHGLKLKNGGGRTILGSF